MNSEIEKILNRIFTHHFNLSGLDWSSISDTVKLVNCQKNTVIREANRRELNLIYVLKGAMGSIMYKNDKLVCVDICFQNEFSGDYQALLTNQESTLEIIAITTCTYLSIPFENLMLVYAQAPKLKVERIGRIAAENLYCLKNSEVIDLKTLSAKERYLKMMKNQPNLLKQIPLKYISAYLSITAESLSRIRKELASQAFLS